MRIDEKGKKLCAFMAIFACLLGCAGCAKDEQDVADQAETETEPATEQPSETVENGITGPYLSITETFYTDETETDMRSHCYVYDLTSQSFEEKGTVEYTAAYPLAAYSSKLDGIVYAAYSGMGDQIYTYKDGVSEQKTDQFCAVNYIIQCGDSYFAAVKRLEHYCIEPYILDENVENPVQVYPDDNDDRFTWRVGTIPQKDKVIFTYYSDDEERECDDTDEEDAAMSEIAFLDMQTQEVEIVYSTDLYIWGVASDGDTLYYCSALSGTSVKENNIVYALDLATQEQTELALPFMVTGDMALWDNTLYALGWLTEDERGIYSYDLETGEMGIVLVEDEDEFINGFAMNY